jgi:hypothetical protein
MKKYILILLFAFTSLIAYNQIIKGVVIDSQTKNRIPFATLYFNGTSTGIIADHDGNFELNMDKYPSKALTISAIGYYSKSITDLSGLEELTIRLQAKVYEIDEAKIHSKSLVRKRKANLRLLRRELIGETENAWYCKILNEEDITFNYFEDEDTLKAFASKPIIIRNKALGYNITYYLDKFEFYRNTDFTYFMGNFIFEEDSTITDRDLVKENRLKAYSGSRMHFFRSLWAQKLSSNNYKITDLKGKKIKYKNIVIVDEDGNKFVSYDGQLLIYFGHKQTKVAFSQLVYFNKYGDFSPYGIRWLGGMADKRIADWLPLDYLVRKY